MTLQRILLVSIIALATSVAHAAEPSVSASPPPASVTPPIADLLGTKMFAGPYDSVESACTAAVKAHGEKPGDGNNNPVKTTNDGMCEKVVGAKVNRDKSKNEIFAESVLFDFGTKFELVMAVRFDTKWYVASLSLPIGPGRQCHSWRYNIDEISDVKVKNSAVIAVKFSQSYQCSVGGPRGDDNGDYYWQDNGVWLVGLGVSKKPSNTNAIVVKSNQRFELNGKTTSKLLLNASLVFTKDGALKFTGSCVKSRNDKAKCEVGDGNVRSLFGVHKLAFP